MSEVTPALSRPRGAVRPLAFARANAITVAIAVVVFVVAYDNGGFGESTRDTLTIGLWWVLILALALGLLPLVRVPMAAVAAGGLLAALAVLTLLSTFWAADAGGAYSEFTRVALYVAVFTVAVVGSSRENAGSWCNGLALGIVGVTVIALVSRFFPHTFSTDTLIRYLPAGRYRLNFPLGYWNGLAVLIALGIPLLLRVAVDGRTLVARGAALAPIPAMAGAIYLTSSRAGVAAALIGTAAFVLLTDRRWTAAGAVALAGLACAGAVFMLYERNELVNGPLNSTAESQGRSATLILIGICILTGLVFALASAAATREVRPSPIAGWVASGLVVAAVAAGVAAAHPVRQFNAFKQPPSDVKPSSKYIEQHLTSANGSGRWQLWTSAIDEFNSKPGVGRGAGSFQAWWLRNGSIAAFVEDAHSLYLETMGELGIVGLLLLVGVFLVGVGAALSRLLRAPPGRRTTLAAVTAAFLAYAAAAGVDWMWELTIVSVVAFACLGLAAGPATAVLDPAAGPTSTDARPRPGFRAYGPRIAVAVAGLLVVCAVAVPLLAVTRISDSENAAAAGNLSAAISDARNARSIEPWSSQPYLQLALLEEQAGNFSAARTWIEKAIAHDRSDWRLWYTAARIDVKAGSIGDAGRSLRRARELNPRSALFRGNGSGS